MDYVKGDPTLAYCKACDVRLTARLFILKKHARSKAHCERNQSEYPPAKDLFQIPNRRESNVEKSKAEAELKLVGMCTRLNIGFQNMTTIVNTLQSIDKDSNVLNSVKIAETKARNVAVNVIGEIAREDIAAALRDTCFAILVDESTDISQEQGLAINVRYATPHNGVITSKIWDIVRIFEPGKEASANADALFGCIKRSFEEYNVPIDNIFAVCFDGCSTMTGERGGLKVKLEAAIPGIVSVTCPAHSTHLCMTHALSEIPKEIINLIIYVNKMLRSSKRQHNFENLQEELGLAKHKMIKLCPTRWIYLEKCCVRVVEQYDALLQFSEQLSAEKDTTSAKQVYSLL